MLKRSMLLAAILVGAACGGDTAGPVAVRVVPDSPGLAAQSASANIPVKSVKWLGGFANDNRVSMVIGPAGGTIALPERGFTLIVPPGAVASAVTFEVKALGGRAVAYEFQPHGTVFNVPLIFRQDLYYTNFGWGQSPLGGYFRERGQVNSQTGAALVNEQLPAMVTNGHYVEFQIKHFSGYLVSCA